MRISLLVTVAVLVGCGAPNDTVTSASARGSASASTSAARASATPSTSSAPAATAAATQTAAASTSAEVKKPSDAPFVREMQRPGEGDAIDSCTYFGGLYTLCYSEYHEAKSAVLKRYLWRISQGTAGPRKDYTVAATASEEGMPHAEIPMMCDPTKPCGFKDEVGEHNTAFQCLARAHEALEVNVDEKAAKAAHEHACKCDAKGGDFPAYIGSAPICDAAGKPAFIAPGMAKPELEDIGLCSRCDKDKGRAACDREIERLAGPDAELSKWIAEVHIPRCQAAFVPKPSTP